MIIILLSGVKFYINFINLMFKKAILSFNLFLFFRIVTVQFRD